MMKATRMMMISVSKLTLIISTSFYWISQKRQVGWSFVNFRITLLRLEIKTLASGTFPVKSAPGSSQFRPASTRVACPRFHFLDKETTRKDNNLPGQG
jgi:hypothetical protein